jgi:hypothetical protein
VVSIVDDGIPFHHLRGTECLLDLAVDLKRVRRRRQGEF